MSDATKSDLEDFMLNRSDFGEKPLDYPLSSDEKKIAVMGMAVNATIVQLINEGLFPSEQQIHFMGHLQDFMDRMYNGEGIKLPNTQQTLQINSKAGTLYFEAMNHAFTNGSKNFSELKRLSEEKLNKLIGEESGDVDLSPNRILN